MPISSPSIPRSRPDLVVHQRLYLVQSYSLHVVPHCKLTNVDPRQRPDHMHHDIAHLRFPGFPRRVPLDGTIGVVDFLKRDGKLIWHWKKTWDCNRHAWRHSPCFDKLVTVFRPYIQPITKVLVIAQVCLPGCFFLGGGEWWGADHSYIICILHNREKNTWWYL